MLKPFLNKTGLNLWSNRSIQAGENIDSEIQTALENAKVAVLFISPEFLADDSTWKRELPYCIRAAQNNELELLWIPVRTSDYQETELALISAVHDPEHPLNGLSESEKDIALYKIVERIKTALLE